MKINCKQTIAKLFSWYGTLVVLLTSAIVLFSFSTSFAPTKMSDAELSDVEAQSLLSIINYTNSAAVDFRGNSYWTGSQDVIRIKLGIDLNINAHMQSLKMGYWNNGDGYGWDQDTSNFFWGTTDRTTPLAFKGLYIDFGFDNLTNSATRKLNYIELGTMTASGQVTGSLNTTTSMILNGTGQNQGVLMRQTASGRRIITFPNTLQAFIFATKYNYSSDGRSTAGLEGIFQKLPQYDSDNVNEP